MLIKPFQFAYNFELDKKGKQKTNPCESGCDLFQRCHKNKCDMWDLRFEQHYRKLGWFPLCAMDFISQSCYCHSKFKYKYLNKL